MIAVAKTFCAQCDRSVRMAEAANCRSPFCKVRPEPVPAPKPIVEAPRRQGRPITVWTEEYSDWFDDMLAAGLDWKQIAEFLGVTERAAVGRLWAIRQEMGWQAK